MCCNIGVMLLLVMIFSTYTNMDGVLSEVTGEWEIININFENAQAKLFCGFDNISREQLGHLADTPASTHSDIRVHPHTQPHTHSHWHSHMFGAHSLSWLTGWWLIIIAVYYCSIFVMFMMDFMSGHVMPVYAIPYPYPLPHRHRCILLFICNFTFWFLGPGPGFIAIVYCNKLLRYDIFANKMLSAHLQNTKGNSNELIRQWQCSDKQRQIILGINCLADDFLSKTFN